MYTLKSMLAQAVLRAARDPRVREQARQLLRERVVPAARAAVHEVEPGIRKLRSDLAAAARESDPLTRPGEFARGARRRLFPDEERKCPVPPGSQCVPYAAVRSLAPFRRNEQRGRAARCILVQALTERPAILFAERSRTPMDRSVIPECVEVVTGPAPRHAVIWLHGLGADGHDFEPIVPQLGLPPGAAVRFVFPHAPTRPVTINGGMVMRAWYDITGNELVRREDAVSIEASAQLVAGLIEREAQRGIEPGNLVLAGFSQGAVMALYQGLRHPDSLAGILALSGYLALADRLAGEIGEANAATPILMMHGDQDPVIPLFLAESGRQRLASLGCAVQWQTYPMGHGVCMEQVTTVGGWLRARFGL